MTEGVVEVESGRTANPSAVICNAVGAITVNAVVPPDEVDGDVLIEVWITPEAVVRREVFPVASCAKRL